VVLTAALSLGCKSSSSGAATGAGTTSSSSTTGTTGTTAAGGGAAGGAGGATTSSGGAGGATTSSGGAGGAAQGECASLETKGQVVTETSADGAPPAMSGGVIANGTYVDAQVTKYGGAGGGGATWQTTAWIQGGQIAIHRAAGPGPVTATAEFTVIDDKITFTWSCPAGLPPTTFTYSADQSTLWLDDGTTVEYLMKL
jgi:hypothetical protein